MQRLLQIDSYSIADQRLFSHGQAPVLIMGFNHHENAYNALPSGAIATGANAQNVTPCPRIFERIPLNHV